MGDSGCHLKGGSSEMADTVSESEIWLSHPHLELKEQLEDRCNGSYVYWSTEAKEAVPGY